MPSKMIEKKIKKVSRCGVRVIVLVTLWAYGLMAQ